MYKTHSKHEFTSYKAKPTILQHVFDSTSTHRFFFSPNGECLVAINNDNKVFIYNLLTRSVKQYPNISGELTQLVFSPNSRFFATICADHRTSIWNTNTHSCMSLPIHTPLSDIQFSPDNRLLLTKADGGPCALWQVSSGNCARRFGAIDTYGATFTQDGAHIVYADRDAINLGPY